MERRQIFTGWQDKPLEEIMALCRDLVEDPEYPTVRRWRESGGKVVGHFQVYFPEEIVHAAGLLPVKICGAADAATKSTLELIWKAIDKVQLGLDVSWHIFIGIGTLLFAVNMLTHPRFGKILGGIGALLAILLLGFNLYTFGGAEVGDKLTQSIGDQVGRAAESDDLKSGIF